MRSRFSTTRARRSSVSKPHRGSSGRPQRRRGRGLPSPCSRSAQTALGEERGPPARFLGAPRKEAEAAAPATYSVLGAPPTFVGTRDLTLKGESPFALAGQALLAQLLER